MADPRSLDIRDPQIIRHYPADQNAFYWHHRVLLEKCGPGIWIGLTPDGDLERIDLNTVQHIVLERRSPFPAAQAAYVYAFDDMGRGELDAYRRQAKIMNSLFNDSAYEEGDTFQWLVADTSRADFGSVVDDDMVDAGVVFRECGILEKDGEEVFVRKVAFSQKTDWITSKDQTIGYCRLVGLHVDGQGSRQLDLHKAVDLMKPAKLDDWPLAGPRAAPEFLKAVRTGVNDLIGYHLQWAQHSGISPYAASKHEHRALIDALRSFISYDQLDASNSLGIEILVRRVIQIETATARSPHNPDFSGLDLIMEQPIGAGGEAQTLKFSEWIGNRLKEKATIQKQSRLYKEEFSKRRQGSEGDEYGKGKGKNKAKAKAKAAQTSGAASTA